MRGELLGEVMVRKLKSVEGENIFIRQNGAISILEKVRAAKEPSMAEGVSSQKPFGFRTFFKDFSLRKTSSKTVKIYARGAVGWVARAKIEKNSAWVEKWKVLTPRAAAGDGKIPNVVTGRPIVAGPGTCCTETDRKSTRLNSSHWE